MSTFFSAPVATAMSWGFVSSLLLSVLFVLTKRWHGGLSMDLSHGVQKFHTKPTPRVGGLPVLLAVVVAALLSPTDVQTLLLPLLYAGLPAFVFGLAEDLTKRVGVLPRLLATMASGVLGWWLTGYTLTSLDVWGVDALMTYTLASVLFTAFAVGGVANAVNIVDGFNGLASTMATLGFVAYAVMAWHLGDVALAGVALVLAACVAGFFCVNWPFGKLFLGDGGSYFIGFALAWVAVMLIARNPHVSAFAALLVCVHPVTEVLLSVYRRKVKQQPAGMPDRLHFHSLLKRRYILRHFKHLGRTSCNSLTGLLVGSMTLVAGLVANLTYNSVPLSALAFVLLVLGYIAMYARMVRHHWCSPLAFLLVRRKLVTARLAAVK